ncbi:MAG: DUF2213 domain-containing protein [Leptolyngbyaceae cyanobacterium MO_188.B28]|nr:DUF2213 domain-containing protein [Leptolyngbyaceae cyanobacterium MO_188.B28]
MPQAVDVNPSSPCLEEVWRFDVGYLDDSPIQRSEEGFAIAKGVATGTGVFPYRDPRTGRTTWELRHPDDVLHADSLATLGGKPTTIEHPPQLVNPLNSQSFQVGSVGNKINVIPGELVEWKHNGQTHTVKDGLVEVVFNTHRQDAIDLFDAGQKRFLSSGYRCDVVGETGVYNGQPYQRRQKNIRYNHVAHVANPRLGQDMAMRWDSSDLEAQVDIAFQEQVKEVNTPLDGNQNSSFVNTDSLNSPIAPYQGSGRRMATLTIGRATYDDVPESVVAVVNQELEKLDGLVKDLATATQARQDAEGRVADLSGQISDLTAERDRHQGRADALEVELEDVQFQLDSLDGDDNLDDDHRTDSEEEDDSVLRIDANELEQRIQQEAEARVDALIEGQGILAAHGQEGVELSPAMAPGIIRRTVVDALTPSDFEIADVEVPGLYKSFQMGINRSDAVTVERADMLENAVTASSRFNNAKSTSGKRDGISPRGKQRMDNYKQPMAISKTGKL